MSSSLTSNPKDTNTLLRRHGILRMKALSDEESARFIERTVEEL